MEKKNKCNICKVKEVEINNSAAEPLVCLHLYKGGKTSRSEKKIEMEVKK